MDYLIRGKLCIGLTIPYKYVGKKGIINIMLNTLVWEKSKVKNKIMNNKSMTIMYSVEIAWTEPRTTENANSSRITWSLKYMSI